MSTPSRSQSAGTRLMPWLVTLSSWLLARALNMPEPLVHAAALVVFAQLQAIEIGVGKSLCAGSIGKSASGLFPKGTFIPTRRKGEPS